MRCHRAARRSRTRIAVVSVVLAFAARSKTARADPSFALAWHERSDPAACVTEPALREIVAKKLGRDPFVERAHADVVIEGEETSAGARFRAHVRETTRDGAVLGSREIEAESCARLLRATGIVIALIAKPSADGEPEGRAEPSEGAADRETSERAPVASPAPTPSPVPRAPLRQPPQETPAPAQGALRRPFELSLGVGASAAVGILPSASAALRGVARLERARSRWSFEWTAGYTLPQSFRSRTVRGTLSAVDQQVRACFALVPQRAMRVDACGGAFWGAVIPRTAGLKDRNDAWRPLAGPVAALAVQLRQETRAARLDLGVAAPVVGRTLYFQSTEAEPERLYSTGAVIVFLGVSGLLTIL